MMPLFSASGLATSGCVFGPRRFEGNEREIGGSSKGKEREGRAR